MPKKKTRWVPKREQKFWFCRIDGPYVPDGGHMAKADFYYQDDYEVYDFRSNCFRTKREAQAAAKKINEILRG